MKCLVFPNIFELSWYVRSIIRLWSLSPRGMYPLWEIFLGDPSSYLCKFRKKRRRSTSAAREWIWPLLYTKFECRTARPLVGPFWYWIYVRMYFLLIRIFQLYKDFFMGILYWRRFMHAWIHAFANKRRIQWEQEKHEPLFLRYNIGYNINSLWLLYFYDYQKVYTIFNSYVLVIWHYHHNSKVKFCN